MIRALLEEARQVHASHRRETPVAAPITCLDHVTLRHALREWGPFSVGLVVVVPPRQLP